jgi:hypothetical protein
MFFPDNLKRMKSSKTIPIKISPAEFHFRFSIDLYGFSSPTNALISAPFSRHRVDDVSVHLRERTN